MSRLGDAGPTKQPRPNSAWRRGLARDKRGVTSLGAGRDRPAFFGLMLGLMEMGYDLFVQTALNAAVEQAAQPVPGRQRCGQQDQRVDRYVRRRDVTPEGCGAPGGHSVEVERPASNRAP